MAGIRIDTVFTDTTLPTGASLASQLLGSTGLSHWFQADPSYVTLGTGQNIASFTDRVATGQSFTQATSANQATLDANVFGTYAGADFTAANNDSYTLSGSQPTLTAPFSICVVFKTRATTAAQNLLGSFTSGSIRSILNRGSTAAQLQHQYGTSNMVFPIVDGVVQALIYGFDGAYLRGSIGGGVEIPKVAAAGAPGTGTMVMGTLTGGGQPFDGFISDVIMFNNCVLDNPTALANLRALVAGVYGVTP